MFPLKDIWAAAIQNPDDEHTQHECDEVTSDSFVLFHQLAKDGKQCSNIAQHVQSSQHQKSACVSRGYIHGYLYTYMTVLGALEENGEQKSIYFHLNIVHESSSLL